MTGRGPGELPLDWSLAERPPLRGTRVRAGNAMARTRASLLDAAVRLVAERGTRRTSMTDIAQAAGIAKGTLYNHFRNKDEVFAALVEAEIVLIADECRGLELEDALAVAALRIDTHPALRRVADDDPAALAALVGADPEAAGWRAARSAAADVLAASGRDPRGAELVVRWLTSHVAAPDADEAEAGARLLAAVLPLRALATV
ncbi:TetR family transcriptional regulator [Cryptosporangium aurantiacum]|uniref:Transcriptional regulator, TetR family n=1 Tax=Cryptosporangium aurantiacum TaxID=134849 RepID=A0A1M7ISV4_9ACTN|nr:TetR family transcriptional regulator [Cryptosporangium aurantiacum]SHM43882.1 transcriptional regulator, TetR family [Cryptosporangium aurantiacum]